MVSEMMAGLGLVGFEPIAGLVFLAAWSLVLLMVGVFVGRSGAVAVLSAVGFCVAGWLVVTAGQSEMVAQVLRVDGLSVVGSSLVLGLAVLVLPLLWAGFRGKAQQPELYVLLTLGVVGMLGLMAANNLLALYVALELMSFPLYILAAYLRDEAKSSEAGLKYFVLGSLASGVMLFGISVLYVSLGTLDFGLLGAGLVQKATPLALVGAGLVLVGVLFKLSVVPFHMWTPDVYEGAPTPITALMGALPKVAALVLLVRLLDGPLASGQGLWQPLLAVLAGLSMLMGATMAVVQQNVKRLLAYSTIANVGFVLVGVAAGVVGFGSAVVYVAIYGLTTLGIFAAVMLSGAERVEDLRGLAGRNPMLALMMLILLFSLAGVPPLAGFMAKFGVLAAAVGAGYAVLALVGVLASVIALFYCLWLVKVMFFEGQGVIKGPVQDDFGLQLVLAVAVGGVLVLGVMPSLVTDWVRVALG